MPDQPTPEELAKVRHELSTGLLVMQEQMAPVYDAADGIRADLEKRGWSPTAAEQAALTWLCGTIGQFFRGTAPS
ncbi:hypothetical protein AB0M57_04495 [Streptomyces sp. NPDC051597]|uniref:hypothetical protein n=1 Tax=Streptomyces sp. NPDC051597 TaxID=3155049 RepID=UPI003417EAB5